MVPELQKWWMARREQLGRQLGRKSVTLAIPSMPSRYLETGVLTSAHIVHRCDENAEVVGVSARGLRAVLQAMLEVGIFAHAAQIVRRGAAVLDKLGPGITVTCLL